MTSPQRTGATSSTGSSGASTLHLLFLQLRLAAQVSADTRAVVRLNRVITTDGEHFSLGITDHEPVLRAVAEARTYETGVGDSLSHRHLWARSRQVESQLAQELDAENLIGSPSGCWTAWSSSGSARPVPTTVTVCSRR
ncbi:hypothetical protein [Streptomyces longisporus]|uniref:hypothetical protein n=1 Tax=Streptomyces longisporus TaxID=1948 RepID=UPI0031E168D5